MIDTCSIISKQIQLLISKHHINPLKSTYNIAENGIFTKLERKNQYAKQIYINPKLQKEFNPHKSFKEVKRHSQQDISINNNRGDTPNKIYQQNKKLRKRNSVQFRISNQSIKSIQRLDINKNNKIKLTKYDDSFFVIKSSSPFQKLEVEEKLMRKQDQTEDNIKSKSFNSNAKGNSNNRSTAKTLNNSRKNKIEKLSSSLNLKKMIDKFQFDYQIEKQKQYIPKRKFWTSNKVIVSKNTSSKNQLTVTNTRASSDKRIFHKSMVQSIHNDKTEEIITGKQTKNIQKRIRGTRFTCDNDTIEESNDGKTITMTKGRHHKKLFLNKVFKSKTQGLQYDEALCPWSMPQQKYNNNRLLRQYQQIQSYL